MPTQFGLDSTNRNANRVTATHTSLVSSVATLHQHNHQSNALSTKLGHYTEVNIPMMPLVSQHPTNILNDSVHRGVHNSNVVPNNANCVNKNMHNFTPLSAIQSGLSQQSLNSLAGHPNMAALAAAVAAQQKAISSSDSVSLCIKYLELV